MDVRNHPKFSQWLEAQTRLTQVREAYLAADGQVQEEIVKNELDRAQWQFDRLNKEVAPFIKEPIPSVDDLF